MTLMAAGLSAQTTWIVDRLNRPGTHFTDLPPAVNAAAPGDVVVVRYTDPLLLPYTAPKILRSLTVIGTGGGQPGLTGNLEIDNLPAGDIVCVRDFQLAPFAGGVPLQNCGLLVRQNHGTVHIHNVDRFAAAGAPSQWNQWLIDTNPSLVTVSWCTLDMIGATGTLQIRNTPQVTMHACLLQNAPGATAPTLSVDNCELVLTDTTVVGSGIGATGATGAAVEMRNTSVVRIAGTTSTVVTATGAAAVRGAGTNQTVVSGNGATVGPIVGAVLQQQPIVAFAGRIDASDVLQLTMYGDPLAIGVFALGQCLASPVPLFGGNLWLDPGLSGFGDAIPFDFTGRGTWQLQLPPTPGLRVWLQGVAVGATSTFRLTPPTVVFSP